MIDLQDVRSEFDLLRLVFEESSTLGAALGARLLDRIQLDSSDFQIATHQILYAALENLIRAGSAPSLPLLKRAAPELNGEVEKFCAFNGKVLSPEQTEGLADHIRDLARRRHLLSAFTRQAEAIQKGDSVADVVARTQSDLSKLPCSGATWVEPEESCEALERHFNEIQDGTKLPCTPTGIAQLDAAIGGFQPSLNAVNAHGGVGKTALLATVLRNMAIRGEHSLTFSLEDGHRGIRIRHYALESGMSQRALRTRGWSSVEQENVNRASTKVRGWPGSVLIDETKGLTASELLHRARTAIQFRGVRLVSVDNITSMSWERAQRSDLDIQDFLRRGRDLAEETAVPFLVLAHVKGSVDEATLPNLLDCSESGGFAKLARVGIGLARKRGTQVLNCGISKGTFVTNAGKTLELNFDGEHGMVWNG